MAKAGKPKRVFTEAEISTMEDLAFTGCQNGTIANYMDIPATTINDRPDIRKKLTKKRAERKYSLRGAQTTKATIAKDTAMLIFLGKNELGQADRHDMGLKADITHKLEFSDEDRKVLASLAAGLLGNKYGQADS